MVLVIGKQISLMPKSMPLIPLSRSLFLSLSLTHWITRSWVWGPHSCPLHTQLPTQHVALCWLRRWLLLGVLSGSHAQYTLCYRAVNLHWGDRWCHQGSGEGEGDGEKGKKWPMSRRHIRLEFGHAGLLNTLTLSSSVCPPRSCLSSTGSLTTHSHLKEMTENVTGKGFEGSKSPNLNERSSVGAACNTELWSTHAHTYRQTYCT